MDVSLFLLFILESFVTPPPPSPIRTPEYNKCDLVEKLCMSKARLIIPILHAGPHALVAGGRHALDGQLPEAARHHGDGFELAACAGAGAAGVLSVHPLVRAAAHRAVVRAHKRHLHPDPGHAV